MEINYLKSQITELLDKLERACYFTILVLASGFHQIELDKQDIAKRAFSTMNGHYDYKRMPIGLKNAPSTFHRVIYNILRGLNDTCIVYLDDISVLNI